MSRIITPKEFRPRWIIDTPEAKRKRGNPATRSKLRYKDIITAFDIETTYIQDIDQASMYIWQWQFGTEYTVIGRTWEEFSRFVDRLVRAVKYHNENCKLVVYVHNLSYEFQFLRTVYDFQSDEVFCVDDRRILKCTMSDALEFRCSMLHSNMSLKQFTEKMGAKHSKLSGVEFDYSKMRYPWSPMSDKELQYCINDVLGLVEALEIEMAVDKDNLYTIPLTSTGYVRRDAKWVMRGVDHQMVKRMLPDIEVYHMLRKAFRGGNTHANRYYVDKTLHDVHSWDRSSSYPDVIVNCEFPMGPFTVMHGPIDRSFLLDLMTRRHKACLIHFCMRNVSLRDLYNGCPYLSISKCEPIINVDNDNGRVLWAEYLETTVTDIDFRIIMKQYEGKVEILDVAYARYGKLPKAFRDLVIDYYHRKTELKGVEGQEVYYEKLKNKLNALYGMCAMDPVRQLIEFSEERGFFCDQRLEEEILEEYNRKAFLPYQWGVWVTAWARERLQRGIDLAGDGFVYADTDSVKYVGDIDWYDYNRYLRDTSYTNYAYADDPKGTRHYMGVFEEEHSYDLFRTLGAKKYVSQIGDQLKTTIAGVVKWAGGPELEKRGGIEEFKPGFVFYEAGGNELKYNDTDYGIYHVEGHDLFIGPNVVIKPSTYRLGVTHEYYELIEYCKAMEGRSEI